MDQGVQHSKPDEPKCDSCTNLKAEITSLKAEITSLKAEMEDMRIALQEEIRVMRDAFNQRIDVLMNERDDLETKLVVAEGWNQDLIAKLRESDPEYVKEEIDNAIQDIHNLYLQNKNKNN